MSPTEPLCETLWHVTVLSNFARGFDKYARAYSKAGIPESTFPDRFYLLREEELGIGVAKARALMARLARPGERLVALQTRVPTAELHPNPRTGLGRFIASPVIRLTGVAWVADDAETFRLELTTVEEVAAQSLRVLQPTLADYAALRTRTFSVLPVARGCQASCPFCFSEASASVEQRAGKPEEGRLRLLAQLARQRGAERFVITGGGEPGLLPHESLRRLIAVGADELGKAVLITNGHHLARLDETTRAAALADYADAGLRVLAISRHHHDEEVSALLMKLATDVRAVARNWRAGRESWPRLALRLTCVLQRGGVESVDSLADYVEWATALGVGEICCKELYVSTSAESVYHNHTTNAWSHEHQVPLALVLEFAARHGLRDEARLPWGAPVFRGEWRGRPLRLAAYTEPSLLWERTHGLARSWNLMADGRVLASLEDRASEIQFPA